MKFPSFKILSLLLGIVLAGCVHPAFAQNDEDDDELSGPRMPVYFYLVASVTDQINLDMTEDRLHRMLPMLEKYKQVRPDLTATILFSGAVSQALAERNSQTHIVDFVKDYIRRGVIEAGYDGADEPTYKQRPLLHLSLKNTPTGDQRWAARSDVAAKLLTERRDPVLGTAEPGKDGGLKEMQDVFGEAASIEGVVLSTPEVFSGTIPELGSDTEIVHQVRLLNKTATMFGLPEENPMHSMEFRGWAAAFSKDLSPTSRTSPELFWQDDVLRLSESSGPDNRLFHASSGQDALELFMSRLSRGKVRVVHIDIGNQANYLTKAFTGEDVFPPQRYAYSHPDHPQLPPEARRPAAEVNAAFEKEDALLHWLTADYMTGHPQVGFISNSGLKKIVSPAVGFEVSVDGLRAALVELVRSWGNDPHPPKYLLVQGHYLSLADAFQVMADALKEQNSSGKFPSSVRVARVYGPIETINDRTPVTGEVTAEETAAAAALIAPRLHDDAWQPIPNNAIPNRVKVGNLDVTAAQFFRLMVEAILAPGANAKLEAKLTNAFWGRDVTFFHVGRSIRDFGVAWTYKPAVATGRAQ